MSLSKLPCELILTVSDNLPVADLSRLLRACHSLHDLLSPALTARITTEKLAATILRRGIQRNNLSTVHLALAHNAALHIPGDNMECSCALEEACDRSHLDIVEAIIKHYGPKILSENPDPDGLYSHVNPLEGAIRQNNLALTTLLLEHGARANRTVWYGYPSSDKSPLDFAGEYGSDEIAEVLIKHGANVDDAYLSLAYAMNRGSWGVAAVLLREGVDVWEPDFPWSASCPLGERSPEEIEAWVEGGKAYIEECRRENLESSIAERKERLREEAKADAEEVEEAA